MGRLGGRRVQDGEHVIFLKLIKKKKNAVLETIPQEVHIVY